MTESLTAQIAQEKQKARLLKKSNWWNRKISAGECYYCKSQVGAKQLTMDHVMPLIMGGKSKKANLVACCLDCNQKKRDLSPIDWCLYMEGSSKS